MEDALEKKEKPILSVDNLEVVYNEVILVLRGISMNVSEGEIVALLGANGAGKTTLLRSITGLLEIHRGKITKGSVSFLGEKTNRYDPSRLVRAGLSQVMEGRRIFAELTVEEICRRINEELVATWGNLVNRVLSMIYNSCEATIPSGELRTEEDLKLLSTIDQIIERAGQEIDNVELRSALQTGMSGAAEINAYLNSLEPWKLSKTDPERAATVLGTALSAIGGVRVCLSPYLPFSTQLLDEIFGPVDIWQRKEPQTGKKIEKPKPLFKKVDIDLLDLDD